MKTRIAGGVLGLLMLSEQEGLVSSVKINNQQIKISKD
jgi:hypothetical protein